MASQSDARPRFRDLDEYFAYLDAHDDKILYAAGEGLAPEAATANHAPIAANYDPDLTVLCGDRQYWKDRRDILRNPLSIFEISSRTTANIDEVEKLDAYFSIPGFAEYFVVVRHYCGVVFA